MEETINCYACGRDATTATARPFGCRAGQVATWVCSDCRNDRLPAKATETLSGGPRLAWATIARAERMRAAGYGWTVDQVVRDALELLEESRTAA